MFFIQTQDENNNKMNTKRMRMDSTKNHLSVPQQFPVNYSPSFVGSNRVLAHPGALPTMYGYPGMGPSPGYEVPQSKFFKIVIAARP